MRRNLKDLLKLLAALLLSIMLSCDDDIYIPQTEWFYFDIVSIETFHFSRIYAMEGPEIYQDLIHIYPGYENKNEQHTQSAFKLPLSPFSDSVTFIFERPEKIDTIKVRYTQGLEFISRREGIVYLFQDPKITYTTFDSLLVCESCYRIQ